MRRRHFDQEEEGMRLCLRHAGIPRGAAVQLCRCIFVQSPYCAGAEDAVHAGMHTTHARVFPALREEGIAHGICSMLVPRRSESWSGSLRSDSGDQWAAISPSRMTWYATRAQGCAGDHSCTRDSSFTP